jgi:ABC-type branched-subunit amino acid transport system ATPase component
MSFLRIQNVVAGYGSGQDILKGISLDVEVGQTYCIIGPNGAGKSTLLKVISGLLKPREGSVEFGGEDITGLPTHEILRRGLCFVPQDQSLFPDMTVRENLRMGGFVLRDNAEVDRRMEEVYGTFPILKEKAGQPARALSGGQQQTLALGRTLVLRPQLIMLDEPSLGLAPKISRQIFESIARLREAGITVVIVEQNAKLGLQAADWGVVLDLGTEHIVDRAEAILEDPRVAELYLGGGLSTKASGGRT